MLFTVMVAEDDPMVAELHRQLLQRDLRVSGITLCRDGAEAWGLLEGGGFDLALLDIGLPGLDGLTLLERVRQAELPLDAIFVTAAGGWETLVRAQRLGALDYLLKPYKPERLRAALERFFERRELLQQSLTQREADLFFLPPPGQGAAEKGIQRRTLETILAFFEKRPGQRCSCDQAAQAVGLSRVTVQKYLHYLERQGRLVTEIDYATRGRPSTGYVMRG